MISRVSGAGKGEVEQGFLLHGMRLGGAGGGAGGGGTFDAAHLTIKGKLAQGHTVTMRWAYAKVNSAPVSGKLASGSIDHSHIASAAFDYPHSSQNKA